MILAGRTKEKLDETEAAIRRQVPGAELEQLVVDLADLGVGTPGGGARRRRSARSTCWSTTPA